VPCHFARGADDLFVTGAAAVKALRTSRASQPAARGSTAPAIARVVGVSKRFGRVTALDGLDLEVGEGESLGLLGPNGAGKSTLISLLAGIARPSAGTVDVAQEGSPTRSAVRRHIGFAPQALALYPQLSAAENLRFLARLQGVPQHALDERVHRGLQLARLEERAHDRVASFSGGMRRRLNLAAAVLHAPRLVLLDEPTAGVDPQSRQHLYASMERLRAEGATLVICTHLLDEVERLCDRVAILDRGKLRASGTPAALKSLHTASDLQAVLMALTGQELRD
jgi:ABC-2 type transport system ATP-binding protein